MINKVKNRKRIEKFNHLLNDRPKFRVVVYEGDEIIYDNKGFGGVVNIVETPVKVEDSLWMDGVTQSILFGTQLEQLFSFDQLRQKLKKIGKEVEEIVRDMVNKGQL